MGNKYVRKTVGIDTEAVRVTFYRVGALEREVALPLRAVRKLGPRIDARARSGVLEADAEDEIGEQGKEAEGYGDRDQIEQEAGANHIA